MQQLGQYVVTLTASAMITGILLAMLPEGPQRKLLRLTCGIFLTVTALLPLPGLELPDLNLFTEAYNQEGEAMAAMGEEAARAEQNERIKQAMKTYILDKAAMLDTALHPELWMNPDGTPSGVLLTGQWTDQARQQLADIITKDLGIPEEDQQWTQEN